MAIWTSILSVLRLAPRRRQRRLRTSALSPRPYLSSSPGYPRPQPLCWQLNGATPFLDAQATTPSTGTGPTSTSLRGPQGINLSSQPQDLPWTTARRTALRPKTSLRPISSFPHPATPSVSNVWPILDNLPLARSLLARSLFSHSAHSAHILPLSSHACWFAGACLCSQPGARTTAAASTATPRYEGWKT